MTVDIYAHTYVAVHDKKLLSKGVPNILATQQWHARRAWNLSKQTFQLAWKERQLKGTSPAFH